jgi:hypothetical protein
LFITHWSIDYLINKFMKQTAAPKIIAFHFNSPETHPPAGRAGFPAAGGRALVRAALIGLLALVACTASATSDDTPQSNAVSSSVISNLATNRSGASNSITGSITGSASLAVLSQYIFRGYQIGKNSVVLQPTATAEYRGFAVTFWGNADTQEHATPNFVPDRPGQASFNEADACLSYTHNIGKLALSGGVWYYGTQYMDDTEELFVSATYDVISKPTLVVYRDINAFPATYINLSLAHSVPVGHGITADFGASAGYLAGDGSIYRTSGGTGPAYSEFHDGMAKVGLTIPVCKDVVVQPAVQYYFPLSGKAARTGYNPCGALDQVFVYGVSATLSF